MIKKLMKLGIVAAVAVMILIIGSFVVVSVNADGKNYDRVEDVPFNEVGLLLGTSPITPQGGHNYYFDKRIDAAAELYHNGKIRHIIASGGDYSAQNGCNELIAMRDALMAQGVPESAIMVDYDGLRTLRSILNAKESGYNRLTIISQKYHNECTIWLAEHYGIEVVAYNAVLPGILDKKVKNLSREALARVKMFIDLTILN